MDIEDDVVNQSRRSLLKSTLVTLAGAGMASIAPRALSQQQSLAPSTKVSATPKLTQKNYDFDITREKVNPDGVPVEALLVNQQLPGTEIRVKENDILRVTCTNRLKQPTTVHWHGLLLPDPMDGVPNVSQRPIMPGEVFVYEYPIRQTGTYWYHSHVQLQEQLGLAGPFIIEPKREPLSYDQEYVVMVSDWLHQSPYAVLKQLQNPKLPMQKDKGPDLADINYPSFLMNGQGINQPWTCKANPGDLVRFRIINGSASSYYWFMIDDHPFEIVAIDGQDITPIKKDRILMATAERYDILVRVKNNGNFGIRSIVQTGEGQALGVLKVGDSNDKVSTAVPNYKEGDALVDAIMATSRQPKPLPEGPERRYKLTLDGNMKKYIWSINDQVYPDAEPLICAPGDRVYVEMINKTPMYHPMHLHGHFVRPITGNNLANSPLLDIISVPPFATRRFVFFADNPGRWFFHCHNLYHLETGMAREFHYKV